MDKPRISYRPIVGASREAELSALSAIYKLCISSYARKEAAPESRPDDAEGRSNEIGANRSIPR